MKMSKQVRDGLLLGLALVVLTVVAFITFKSPSASPGKPSAPRPAAAAGARKGTKAAATPDDMTWVNTVRLGSAIGEVQGGRNPFDDLLPTGSNTPGRATRTTPAPRPASRPAPGAARTPPAAGSFTIPDQYASGMLPPVAETLTQSVSVKWLSLPELKSALAKEKLMVTVAPAKPADTYALSGPRDDVLNAVALLPDIDVAPPVPEFTLTGVITTPSERFAVISVNGKTYSMYEHEKIPELGWTVKKITATVVTMQKGKQTIPIRLGGGKA